MTEDSPWRSRITAEDYERHMQATGQPRAIGELLGELFRERPPTTGARVWFAGAGTGQWLDYFEAAALDRYRVTCTDINPWYLERLSARLRCAIALDDLASPAPPGEFDLAIMTLVLEHVDWRRAVARLCAAAPRVFAVIQEDPPDLPALPLLGTMAELRDARLLDRAELIAAFAAHGFTLGYTAIREVRDGKKMVALEWASARPRNSGVPAG